ncbi:WEB family protein At1g75720-like [Salvia hispanica]|uniref:WEB family protein At1g75720-like n=1 Tax=Salvia hispanica TaxID=49212 RepID=UPI0020095EDA|nr:WEB family protein At1g75720-like [Salvia hispanica]
MQGGEGVVVRGRVEIDTRQPFRSVREAVMLFGEKVLAGEVYGNKLKEMQNKAKNQPSKLGAVKAELEETKETLSKAKEEGNLMAHCLNSLRQELEQTKKELRHLKTRETLFEREVEEVKFIDNTKDIVEMKHEGKIELQKKRSVKFASPQLLTKVLDDEELKKKTKKKKKPLVPLIGGLFLKKIKKGAKESES